MQGIILSPTADPTNIGICIKEMSDRKIGNLQYFDSPMFMSLEYWKPHHLHLVSDDYIRDGDWYVEINKVSYIKRVYKNIGSDLPKTDSNYFHADLYRILESTDESLELPMPEENVKILCEYY